MQKQCLLLTLPHEHRVPSAMMCLAALALPSEHRSLQKGTDIREEGFWLPQGQQARQKLEMSTEQWGRGRRWGADSRGGKALLQPQAGADEQADSAQHGKDVEPCRPAQGKPTKATRTTVQ